MEYFLDKLSGEIISRYGENFSRLCIVFPSRRAGIFFRKYLAEKLDKPVWAPDIFAIQDFIAALSPVPVTDKLTLVFELYEVYRKFSSEPFDKFYQWGEMLLKDFDDIDKNLAEADYLFRIIRELKKVEQDFELKVSDIDSFYKFWQSFSNKELTDTQNDFLKTWEILGKVYHAFRKSLVEKNICYEGMAYRKIYEMTRTKELTVSWDKIVFAGFNQLNRCEEGIINELAKQGKAETFWDADKYYLDDNIQEAGHFLRKNFVNLGIEKNLSWTENNLTHTKKNIKVIGAPLLVSQAKALGNELKTLKKDNINKTAVVLPDEGMLLPVLHSLPENIDSLNVTMSFPMRETPLYSLLLLLKSLQKNRKGSGSSVVFYHKDVERILLHPYIKFTAPASVHELIYRVKRKNIIYISKKRIAESFNELPEIISAVFKETATAAETLEYIYNILRLLSEQFSSGTASRFEAEYIFKFYKELNHLNNVMAAYSAEISPGEISWETVWNLIAEITASVNIPFAGEPLKGLQVMGLLETRLLDFENVYILSMNEDIIPRGNKHGSFIPYSLRKAFKLPTYEDEDATSAYYFYRLLGRAKNITLIYNTEPGKIFAGEKSRFIMQIENELAPGNDNISFEQHVLQADVEIPKRREITIPKTKTILDALKNEEYFSATTLSRYINCPLQFYFNTAVKLREEETVEEFFTGGGFGTILHQIMDMMYSDYTGKTVDEAVIKTLRAILDKKYDKLWEDACAGIPQYEEFKTGLRGRNLLYKNIIKKLIAKILDNDLKEVPFSIISVETKMTKPLEIDLDGEKYTVNMLGRLDRVEEKDGVLRVVDYKTGNVNLIKMQEKLPDESFGIIFEDPVYKEKFQQYFYSYIYPQLSAEMKINVGIYPLKSTQGGIKFFEEKNIPPEKLKLFEEGLKAMLIKIFDTETPFTQTPHVERCLYCPYKSLCFRD